MFMKAGERWHCTNANCHCEVLVQSDSEIDGENPRCACGSVLKKRYSAPSFTYLDFLRMDEPTTVLGSSRKP